MTGQPWRPPTILVARFEIFPCALRFTFAWSLEQVARLAPHLQPPTWAPQLGLHCSFPSSCDIFVCYQPTVVSSIPAASCHWRPSCQELTSDFVPELVVVSCETSVCPRHSSPSTNSTARGTTPSAQSRRLRRKTFRDIGLRARRTASDLHSFCARSRLLYRSTPRSTTG